MNKLVVYFRSLKHEDVSTLRSAFTTLVVDVDKDQSYENITLQIDFFLIDHFLEDFDLVFIGDSWASKLSKEYDCKSLLINSTTSLDQVIEHIKSI